MAQQLHFPSVNCLRVASNFDEENKISENDLNWNISSIVHEDSFKIYETSKLVDFTLE